MYEGFTLVKFAFRGIMDVVDELQDKLIKEVLINNLPGGIQSWHGLRHRTAGRTTWIELHALFDNNIKLEEAHDIATELEKRLINAIEGDAVVTIHLEPEENHNEVHDPLKGANENLDLDQFI